MPADDAVLGDLGGLTGRGDRLQRLGRALVQFPDWDGQHGPIVVQMYYLVSGSQPDAEAMTSGAERTRRADGVDVIPLTAVRS